MLQGKGLLFVVSLCAFTGLASAQTITMTLTPPLSLDKVKATLRRTLWRP